jgi:hypothetical protein
MKIATLLTAACVAFQGAAAAAVSGKPSTFIRDYDKRDLLQDVVSQPFKPVRDSNYDLNGT